MIFICGVPIAFKWLAEFHAVADGPSLLSSACYYADQW